MSRKFVSILVLFASITILLSACVNLEFINGKPVNSDTSEIAQDLTESPGQKETEKQTEAQTTKASTETKPIVKKDFVINIITKKFHSPTCHYVDMMKDENKSFVSSTYQDLVDDDYSPCSKCQ